AVRARPQEIEKRKPVVPLENVSKMESASAEKSIQKSLENTSSEAMKASSVESASSSQKGTSQQTKKNPIQSASSSASSAVEKTSDKSSQNIRSETSTDSKNENITYKKSVEELLEEQLNSAETPQWNESLFASDSVQEVSSHESDNAAISSASFSGAEALSGTAGTSADDNSGAVAQVDKPTLQREASQETLDQLNRIAQATYTAPAIDGVVSSVSVNSATNSDGSVSIEMVDRSTRILLDPQKPYIILSEESASFIDSSRKVVIEFAVLPSGAVPFSRVDFIPSSLLPQTVQSEIREQISKWRFSTSSSEALARLEYNIKKQ
ncbi:MAG: hypothetical protein K2M99_08325, partial [Treponemataceae bacterium]|nr:hypothetical protein [Treponemataceae bacterium]